MAQELLAKLLMLAQSGREDDGSGWARLLFPLIVMVIYGLAALVKKRQEESEQPGPRRPADGRPSETARRNQIPTYARRKLDQTTGAGQQQRSSSGTTPVRPQAQQNAPTTQRPAAQRTAPASQRPAAQRTTGTTQQRPAAQRTTSTAQQRPAAQRTASTTQRPAAQRAPTGQTAKTRSQAPAAGQRRPAAQTAEDQSAQAARGAVTKAAERVAQQRTNLRAKQQQRAERVRQHRQVIRDAAATMKSAGSLPKTHRVVAPRSHRIMVSRLGFADRANWPQAVIYSEVLGAPVGLRQDHLQLPGSGPARPSAS